jgi:hypothetical protein
MGTGVVRDVPGGGLAVTGIGLDGHVTVYDVARQLPAIADLRDLCRSLAMLDAILSPDWEDRSYSMNAHWADGEEMASMRNGSGNEYSIVFSTAGAYMRGFDHESPMSPYGNDGEPWPGVIDEVPELFKPFVEESAFTDEDGVPVVTACLWRGATDDRWHHGTIDFPDRAVDPDGATGLFELLVDRSPEAFQRFAEDYYEVPVDLEAVSQVYALRPLSPAPGAGEAPDGGVVQPQPAADRGQGLALGQQLLHRRVPLGGAGHQPPRTPEDVPGALRQDERRFLHGRLRRPAGGVAHSVTAAGVVNALRMHW